MSAEFAAVVMLLIFVAWLILALTDGNDDDCDQSPMP
jgi:hypothetical protein